MSPFTLPSRHKNDVLRPTALRSVPTWLALLLMLVSVASLPGCAWLFHRPRADASLPLGERPWRVHCSWVVNPSGRPDEPPGPIDSGAVWAEDEGGRRLVLVGALEDGFLRVDSARVASDSDDRDFMAVEKISRAKVEELCETTVRRLPSKDSRVPKLYSVMAARDGENVDVAMVFPAEEKRGRISRVVVFGDSLSDSGNLKRRLLIFPSSPYWLGRFSNGPNWADYLGRRGFAVQNHAYGGAVAVPHDDVPAADLVAAIEQGGQHFVSGSIDRYVDDHIARDLTARRVGKPSETVYVLWGGANDYLSKEPFRGDIGTLLDRPGSRAGYRRVVAETVAGISGQIRRLHAAGARNFLVPTLPDFARTPIVLHNESYQPQGVGGANARRVQLAHKLSRLTAYHNTLLRRAMAKLSRELKGAHIVLIDADSAIGRVRSRRSPDGRRPFDYGFATRPPEQIIRVRGAILRQEDRCYRGGYLGGSDPRDVCKQAPLVFFWDTVHPSTFAHCWIGWLVQSQLAKAGMVANVPTVQEAKRLCLRAVEAQSAASSGSSTTPGASRAPAGRRGLPIA